MLFTGSSGKTVVFRDFKSGRAVFASGYMDTDTFLRKFCGKQK
jgi:hypothetical protein